MTALRRIPVRITGDWQPVAYVGHVDWHGAATADEPITALVLGRDATGLHWSRVGRAAVTELTIELRVRPSETDRDRYAVRMHLLMQPVGKRWSDGAGAVHTDMHLTSTAPFMFSLDHHETGVVSWFAHPWTAAKDRLGALFVVESETRSARNHLWHVRKSIDGPSVGLRAALGYGRSGTLPASLE